jgi:hypothetical protein
MLWLLLSFCCCWLIFRELRRHWFGDAGFERPASTPVHKPYVAVLAALAVAFAWPPFQSWRFERMLSAKATELADSRLAKVHCNTVFDTFFDREYLASGHADPGSGEIVLQYPWCRTLMEYLDHPERANEMELASLNLFTHESMHARGERNEAVTECQAVQRNRRAAQLLGVPDAAARKGALAYYRGSYLDKGRIGGMQAAYFSAECAPGKALDERLIDSTWATP